MAAPNTVFTYPLDGTNKTFDVPFEYLARKFVVITLIGATRRVLFITSEFRFVTKKQISTIKAWGEADGFESIEVRRITSATERLVDFSDGSILRAYDLNTSQVQSLHIAEEARDLTSDTIAVNNNGDLDARGKRVANVADGVDPGDAVTMRQEQSWAASTLNNKETAVAAANTATTQASNATVARQASEAARNLSSTYAGNSEGSSVQSGLYALASDNSRAAAVLAQNAALTYRDAAKVSQDTAKVSETNSKTSETNAAASAASLGNAVSLYSKVSSVVGDVVTWTASVSHRIGALLLKDNGVTNGSYKYTFGADGKLNSPVAVESPAVNGGSIEATLSMKAKGKPVVIASQSAWTPLQTTPDAAGLDVTHSLGVIPFGYSMEYRCRVADNGYAVGDIVTNFDQTYDVRDGTAILWRGLIARLGDATKVNIHSAPLPAIFPHKTTGAANNIALASWDFRITATGLAS